jgi:hypothetical protein
LLAKCQSVVVPFAYIMDLPLRQTLLTDTGLITTDNENVRKAFKWEYNNTVEALTTQGYSAQESLILFLKANRADFPLWENSPYNNPSSSAIIRDGADLGAVIGLLQPHRCFMLLQPIFQTLTEEFIKPALGDEYYDAFNQRIISGSLRPEEQDILPQLRMSLARKALAKAAVEMSVRFQNGSFTIIDGKFANDTPDEGRVSPAESQLNKFAELHERSARFLLERLVTSMNKKASAIVFPEYYLSDTYQDPMIDNKPDNSLYTGTFRMN